MNLCKELRLNIWNTKVHSFIHSFIAKIAVYMKEWKQNSWEVCKVNQNRNQEIDLQLKKKILP